MIFMTRRTVITLSGPVFSNPLRAIAIPLLYLAWTMRNMTLRVSPLNSYFPPRVVWYVLSVLNPLVYCSHSSSFDIFLVD